jgi:DNA-binding transcriptional regulator/RsmH inhibitor MraZ
MFPGRLDANGRLKLPASFQQYFGSLPEKKLFVTSLDERIAQIYPISAWRENEKFFESYVENPEVAQDVWFTANDLGADGEPDTQGRLTFPAKLRKALSLDNTELHLYSYRGRVQVLTDAVYEERKQRSSRRASDNVTVLERAGLK